MWKIKWKYKPNDNSKIVILNTFFSLEYLFINGAEFLKFGILVLGKHFEGTVSEISHLGPIFYFMKKNLQNYVSKNGKMFPVF